jgi:hypothetical protein
MRNMQPEASVYIRGGITFSELTSALSAALPIFRSKQHCVSEDGLCEFRYSSTCFQKFPVGSVVLHADYNSTSSIHIRKHPHFEYR